ncbi:hypothetical protein FA95DRAFT_1140788 [Auriscalpium vulgare]|uniref:Uncharacterized protein n=1 Tax=Auriscalpium vulgare TaxID=40419 RepID=A0ACB8RV19_9AGAM|nr:hypothetical protein FA95DRAFT_1140788 [Auriscalpium vulgare]
MSGIEPTEDAQSATNADERPSHVTATTPSPTAPTQATPNGTPHEPLQVLPNSPHEPLNYVNSQQLLSWLDTPEPKCVIRTFDEASTHPELHPTIHRLVSRALLHITGPNAQLDPPRATRRSSPPPNLWLLHNIPAAAARHLLAAGVVSTALVTFQVLPITPTPAPYLFSLRGFHTTSTTAVRELVLRVWTHPDTLHRLASISVMDHEGDYRSPLPEDIPLALHSLSVIRGAMYPTPDTAPPFHILIDPSLVDEEEEWDALCEALSTLKYSSPEIGRGIVAPRQTCSLCHSAGHERATCPFPTQAGWPGPQRTDCPHRINGADHRNT